MSAASGSSDRAQPSGPWRRIEEIVNGGASADELRIHRLHLIAARVWAAQGRTIPAALQVEQRLAAARAMAAPALLEKMRAAYSGPLMLHKGPELAARFPDPLERPFRDLDLIAEDPAAAQDALLAAGFVEVRRSHQIWKRPPPSVSAGVARRTAGRGDSSTAPPAPRTAAGQRRGSVRTGGSQRNRDSGSAGTRTIQSRCPDRLARLATCAPRPSRRPPRCGGHVGGRRLLACK